MQQFLVSDDASADVSYGNLLQSVQPKKIETEKDYEKFLSVLESLLEKDEDSGLLPSEDLLVDLLLVLVQAYEKQATDLPSASPLDVLRHLMEANNLSQANLVGVIGSSGVVSEVMNGKREISKSQARSLGERFKVSYKLFL
ncbi:MAG: type II toxin-antitoxin system HigA family antitoxin [Phormidesmis sp.]